MGFFSKKDKSKQEEDPNAAALFGNRAPAPASSSSNPYAGSKSNQQGGYSSPASSYRGAAPASNPKQAYTGQASPNADPNASALFGNRQPAPSGPPPAAYGRQPANPPPSYAEQDHGESAYGTGAGGGRPRTEQDEEDEEVDAIKSQLRFTKQESVASTRNALRVASQAEETGRDTLARLGEQGERLYNTERHLDVARSHNLVAEEKSRELKTVTRSMFAVHMKNPMKSKSRAEAEEQKILNRAEEERLEREATRLGAYQTKQRVGQNLRGEAAAGVGRGRGGRPGVGERSRYQIEGGDEEDDALEDEIGDNLEQLGGVVGRLKQLAVATGEETDRQNEMLVRLGQKSDRVDNQIALTHNRIKKIR